MVLAFICQAHSQIIFVKQDATGNGTSWSDATGDLAKALHQATAGTQIWVATGTYKPTAGNDRKVSFEIKDGVQVFGGFQGTESTVETRNIAANPTILTGEIGQPGKGDNSYNVVYIKKASAGTLLDGLTIAAGNANSDAAEGERTRCGGGLFIDGKGGDSKPVIRNCTFTGNLGRDGAAVYINGRSGKCSPVFDKCHFNNNEAGLDGGAVYNDGRLNGLSNPIFTDCTFERNMGTYGGAICNASENGNCNLTLENCTFKENAAYLRGGAVFSLNGIEKCYLDMTDCNFTGNYPDDQNMIFTSNTARSEAYKITKAEP